MGKHQPSLRATAHLRGGERLLPRPRSPKDHPAQLPERHRSGGQGAAQPRLTRTGKGGSVDVANFTDRK